MIRNLLATTAIATLVATGAAAQTTTQPSTTAPSTQATPTQPEQPMVKHAEGDLASNLIGKTVYNGTGDDAQNIGKVNDLVIDKDGKVKAIVVGVGGFLGIGQKEVALEYNLVQRTTRDNEELLVVETTADALKAQEEFDRAAYEPMPADADVSETKPATKEDLAAAPAGDEAQGEAAQQDTAATGEQRPADDTTAAKPEDQAQQDTAATTGEEPPAGESAETSGEMAAAQREDKAQTDQTQTGAIDKSNLKQMQTDKIKSEELVGTTVYGQNDQKIGEIGDVVLTEDGKVDAVLVDVGGFLGVGEKQVALGMDKLQFMTDENGNLYLYTGLTEDKLKQQPAYDKATYAEKRDEMRMTVE